MRGAVLCNNVGSLGERIENFAPTPASDIAIPHYETADRSGLRGADRYQRHFVGRT